MLLRPCRVLWQQSVIVVRVHEQLNGTISIFQVVGRAASQLDRLTFESRAKAVEF